MATLFDTDVLIDYFYNKEPGTNIVKQYLTQTCAISVITWAELLYGAKKSKNSNHVQKLEGFISTFKISIMDIDKKVIDSFTDLKLSLEKKGTMIPDFDLLIATTALVHNLTLTTRNKKHFQRIPHLRLETR